MLVIPPWLTTREVKLELVETCSWYEVAPAEAFQLNVGLVETPVALLDGEDSVGARGVVMAPKVVKPRALE